MDLSIFKTAIPSMGILGALFAGGLAYASVKFAVEEDPRKEKIEEALPGANCGACGQPGCSSFAEGVVNGDLPPDGCPVGGAEAAEKIAAIMGLETSSSDERKIAQVLCQGGRDETFAKADYQGVDKCRIADMEANINSCAYGCLGFGDCIDVCPFDAISMNDNGLPEVDPDKCTGCGKCVDECPRGVIALVSNREEIIVKCNSKDRGKDVKENCTAGCIGCTLCAKKCPVDAITMKDNLPVVDKEECIGCGACVQVCPTNAIAKTPFETIKSDKNDNEDKALVITDECVGCTICASKCPVDAITGEKGQKHELDQDKCVECEQCISACPKDAIEYQ